ncbi:FG-GAP repeat protein [Streptomyces agglomeratus]|uniref:FG-GAP repeat protein n=1 Tax=Streptomyces agglomeratus TaxID=285458 RepID=UPI00099F5899|nr:integrin alpha [Streptomyces agglomeratus]
MAVTAPATTVIYAADESGFYDRQVLAGGTTLAAGDLNGDGRQDLASGLPDPFPVTGGITDPSGKSGYVMVHYGSAAAPGGLNATRHTYHQNTAGIPGSNENEDRFGAAMSIADVTGDGYAELAVGVPYESLGGALRGGDVLVLRGGARGVSTTGSVRLSQNTSGIPGTAENNDVFGYKVRLADFNRNGKADLAVSAPYENPYNNEGSGAIWQLHGTSNGLTTSGADVFDPADYGIARGSGLGDALND